jgi:phosphomannomutase
VDIQLTEDDIDSQHTKIGSPYVIEAMRTAIDGSSKRVVGWEVNGGFLLGGQMTLDSGTLEPLQTRDAFLPIFVALIAAVEAKQPVSELFAQLPARYTQAGLIDDFPTDVSGSIIERLGAIEDPNDSVLSEVFAEEHGFDEIVDVSTVDGVRIRFANGDITHLRPSGNAPQFRVYSIADSQARADEIVELGVAEPDGLIRQLETKPKT